MAFISSNARSVRRDSSYASGPLQSVVLSHLVKEVFFYLLVQIVRFLNCTAFEFFDLHWKKIAHSSMMANDSHLLNIRKCSSSSFQQQSTEPLKFPIGLHNKKTISPRSSYLVSLLASMEGNIQEKEVNADAILEDHLSRIWEDSSNVAINENLSSPLTTQHSVSRYSISPHSISKFSPPMLSRDVNNYTSPLPVTFQRAGIDLPLKLAVEEFSSKTKINQNEKSFDDRNTSDLIRCSWCDSVEDLSCTTDQGTPLSYLSQPHTLATAQHRHTKTYTFPNNIRHLKTFSFLIGNSKLDNTNSTNNTNNTNTNISSETPQSSNSFSTNFKHKSIGFEKVSQKSFTHAQTPSLSVPPLSCISVSSPRTIARDMCTCGALSSSSPLSLSSSTSIPASKSQQRPISSHENIRTAIESREASILGECPTTVVGYYFCDDPIPYRTTLPCRNPTLGQFKRHLNKKGNLKFFFKKASDEFDSGVVHEEVTDDEAFLPMWEGKVIGKIELKQ